MWKELTHCFEGTLHKFKLQDAFIYFHSVIQVFYKCTIEFQTQFTEYFFHSTLEQNLFILEPGSHITISKQLLDFVILVLLVRGLSETIFLPMIWRSSFEVWSTALHLLAPGNKWKLRKCRTNISYFLICNCICNIWKMSISLKKRHWLGINYLCGGFMSTISPR